MYGTKTLIGGVRIAAHSQQMYVPMSHPRNLQQHLQRQQQHEKHRSEKVEKRDWNFCMFGLIYWANSLNSQFNAQSLKRFCFMRVTFGGGLPLGWMWDWVWVWVGFCLPLFAPVARVTCKFIFKMFYMMFSFDLRKKSKNFDTHDMHDTRAQECVPPPPTTCLGLRLCAERKLLLTLIKAM